MHHQVASAVLAKARVVVVVAAQYAPTTTTTPVAIQPTPVAAVIGAVAREHQRVEIRLRRHLDGREREKG